MDRDVQIRIGKEMKVEEPKSQSNPNQAALSILISGDDPILLSRKKIQGIHLVYCRKEQSVQYPI